jgi:hypothetical protein
MADDKVVEEGENKETKTSSTPAGNEKKKRKGFISRIWNGILGYTAMILRNAFNIFLKRKLRLSLE